MAIEGYRQHLDRLLADLRQAKQSVATEKKALAEAKAHAQATSEAQSYVQGAAEAVQNVAHQKIASVVSRCLQGVFGDDYEFKITFVKKRGRTEAELSFVKGGHEIDPLLASGGGVVDVASFALRLACLLLIQPAKRRLLVLDESFKWVSADYIPIVRELLLSLSQELRIQFVLVTHIRKLVCGKVITIEDS